jgi:hypothetical protein
MAYVIFLKEQNGFVDEQYPTFEDAQTSNEQYQGIIMTVENAQRFVEAQQQPQEQPYGPDQSEEEWLESNRRANDYNRERKLLYIPKREQPLHTQPAFNSKPVGHMFRGPTLHQENFRPPPAQLHIIRSRPIRRSYYE